MITCSTCGVAKREGNQNWFFAWPERSGARFCVLGWEEDPELRFEQGVEKLCGMECVVKSLAKWMGRTYRKSA